MSTRRRTPATADEVVRFFMTVDVFEAVTLYRAVRGVLDERGAFTSTQREGPARPRAVARRQAAVAEPRTET